ncbi:hypothetical protein ACNI65_10010 [Roseateles sp. So40a]|uniref:hypothetical protein n=1 Tax=Roseateles sp. So40a TaxID=3400226 RepID=UPI003A8BE3D2
MLSYLLKRLGEPTTWIGIGTVVATAAQAVATKDPAAVAATIGGLAGILMPEKGAAK